MTEYIYVLAVLNILYTHVKESLETAVQNLDIFPSYVRMHESFSDFLASQCSV